MILLTAVVAGLIAGIIRAKVKGRQLRSIVLRLEWLAFIAFLPQIIAFQLPFTRGAITDQWARVFLVSSQALLLIFTFFNLNQAGLSVMGLGLALNLLVILLNGGLMPISPEVLERFFPGGAGRIWQIGERVLASKDIVLPKDQTTLWFLSDRLTFPEWIPLHVAFSVGDIFIWIGAFLLLWSLGGESRKNYQENVR
jgi:hypothetical protein